MNDNQTDEQQDCRERGIGHDFRRFSETETENTYFCTTCGKEMRETKKPMILPPRRHEV